MKPQTQGNPGDLQKRAIEEKENREKKGVIQNNGKGRSVLEVGEEIFSGV